MAGESSPSFDVPENVGCNPHCVLGRKLSNILRDEELFVGQDELPLQISGEIKEILDGEPCTHIQDGICKIGDYLLQNVVGLRILTDGLEVQEHTGA